MVLNVSISVPCFYTIIEHVLKNEVGHNKLYRLSSHTMAYSAHELLRKMNTDDLTIMGHGFAINFRRKRSFADNLIYDITFLNF